MQWADDWKHLNLDRLHAPHVERGAGRTMGHIAAMVGEARLGQPGNNYLYVAETYNMRKWIVRDFQEVLEYEGIQYTPNGEYRNKELWTDVTRLFVQGWKGVRTFDFYHMSHLIPKNVRGRQWDRIFLDVSAPMRMRFREGMELLTLCDKGRTGEDYVYWG